MQNQNLAPTQGWHRSTDGVIAGVCQGLAERLGVGPWTVRILWILSVLVFGVGFLFYFLCALCLTREDRAAEAHDAKVLGVCARVARSFDIDPGIVRLLAVLIGLGSFGTTVLMYVVLHFVVPESGASLHKLPEMKKVNQ